MLHPDSLQESAGRSRLACSLPINSLFSTIVIKSSALFVTIGNIGIDNPMLVDGFQNNNG
jgi:hypothetical protein